MKPESNEGLWANRIFLKLYWAHVISLIGTGISSIALGLLAHALVGASASAVLGYTLAIRIAVIVLFSPWAGQFAERFGARATMIWSDLLRVGIVAAFFFVDAVWQIYVLAFFLNLGSALFTPVYKAVIPGVVSNRDYPKALAAGSIAYDTSSILGPALAGLLIATIGFRGSFLFDAATFLVSALLVIALPRTAIEAPKTTRTAPWHGLGAMFGRAPLRESLLLALQVSVAGAFVLVATVDFVKNDLALPDRFYAWAMAVYGIGSVCGAVAYSRCGPVFRNSLVSFGAPAMILALALVGHFQSFPTLLIGWGVIGAVQSLLGIRGSELLAANSNKEERAHIYSAHFALSHAGWGITYPLAGILTARWGFAPADWIFAGLVTVVAIPYWILHFRRRDPERKF
jgi:NRE family putative nickel resistance protein-like MFS transporter